MSHINKLGGPRSQNLSNLAIELWNYALNRNLIISANKNNSDNSREAKCPGRSQIKNFQRFHRMDAQSKDFQGSGSQAWSTRHRPIHIESEPLDTGVRIMATRAKCGGNQCIQSDMELPSELSISSIQPDSSVPQKDTERSSRMHSHCTSLEKQTVVSNSSVNVVTPACTVTSVLISSSTPRNEQDSHLLYSKVFQTSCMESFRQRLQGQGFPQEVSEILLSSWRKSTARQYESAWRSWSGWCDSWQINCFSTSTKNILTYLAHLFYEKGLQYRTINVYRSAISAFYIPIDGVVIRKHPLVSKFMKGVFCLRPPEPKYFVTWDVNQVLILLESWSPADSIMLKQLTLKLFMLAALISAARKSFSDKFDLRLRFFKSNGVLFKVPGLTKCANQNKPIERVFSKFSSRQEAMLLYLPQNL